MSDVRTRFAPSPTGFLHLGGARTALYNWAFARRAGGRFLLRIEDTDRERSTAEFVHAVLEGLRWLGLDWDGEPRLQSDARARHDEVVEELLSRGRAYRCVCSPEELEARRRAAEERGGSRIYDGRCRDAGIGPDAGPHVVRLRMPDAAPLAWEDLVYGPSARDAAEIGDAILRRRDGSPLYNLAVVVDDLDMAITHVIRGEDHRANTALQLALYRALERDPPRFAHLPLIVNPSGKKLSKRRDSVSVQQFQEEGFLPEALVNWLARIGWSHGDQETFSLPEIVALFTLEAVHRSPGQADPGKLLWLGQHWIKALPRADLLARLEPFLAAELGGTVPQDPGLPALVDLLRERSQTLTEMARQARFLLVEQVDVDEKAARKHLRPESEPLLAELQAALDALERWDEVSLEGAFDAVRQRAGGIGMGKLAQPVRVAVTGAAASPGIFETLAALGRERSLRRIETARLKLRSG
ncbi:MAG: glutamate--tRNA ligase [Myxococcota bacterium]